jgi:nucleotide-binding universal stress UspA family protein
MLEGHRGEETTMGQQHTVVVGVDGSTGSRVALRYALEDAARRGTGVRVVSALVPPQFTADPWRHPRSWAS